MLAKTFLVYKQFNLVDINIELTISLT